MSVGVIQVAARDRRWGVKAAAICKHLNLVAIAASPSVHCSIYKQDVEKRWQSLDDTRSNAGLHRDLRAIAIANTTLVTSHHEYLALAKAF